ncbi:MAG: response regulator [Bacteroidales bacterium]|nr:response regulator [Bacteroidales bacterium]
MHVLVVDDFPSNIFLIENILKRHGHTSDSATNGYEALEKLDKFEFGLIFMDLQMDQLDGLSTARIIRNEQMKDKFMLPIVALTGNELNKDSINLCSQLFNTILRKPYSKEEVIEIVNIYDRSTVK